MEEATESDITETEVRKEAYYSTVPLSTTFSSYVDELDDRRHQETPDEIVKGIILKLGEVVSHSKLKKLT